MPRKGTPPVLAEGVLADDDPRKLTDKQNAFIDNYVENGGDGLQAALDAGYSDASAKSSVSRMLRNPLIQQRILKATLSRIGMLAPQALHTVFDLVNNSRSDYVKLQAAQDILDRSGFRPPDRIDHRVDANLTVSFDIAPPVRIIEGEGGSKPGPQDT